MTITMTSDPEREAKRAKTVGTLLMQDLPRLAGLIQGIQTTLLSDDFGRAQLRAFLLLGQLEGSRNALNILLASLEVVLKEQEEATSD